MGRNRRVLAGSLPKRVTAAGAAVAGGPVVALPQDELTFAARAVGRHRARGIGRRHGRSLRVRDGGAVTHSVGMSAALSARKCRGHTRR